MISEFLSSRILEPMTNQEKTKIISPLVCHHLKGRIRQFIVNLTTQIFLETAIANLVVALMNAERGVKALNSLA